MKDSYRIGKILKKLTGLKFFNSQQTSEISDTAKSKAASYHASRKKTVATPDKLEDGASAGDKYVRYQKELEASRLLNKPVEAVRPGTILKLPVDRKELKFDDEI